MENLLYILRGGSWRHNQAYARPSMRFGRYPVYSSGYFGFRVLKQHLPENVIRGGSWANNQRATCCACRSEYFSDYADDYCGFRVVGSN